MGKFKIKYLVLIFTVFLMTGCWDYVGVDNISIVTGMAIDKDDKTNNYKAAFEVVNIDVSNKIEVVKTEIVETMGKTLFDTSRNAKKRLMNKLYFGDMEVVIIDKKIAEKDGINTILNWFLRDTEIRGTLNFVISEEKTAMEILNNNALNHPIVGLLIKEILKNDNEVTSSTIYQPLYRAYNNLHDNGCSLAFPIFRIVENDGKETLESNGIAVFKKDKMIGQFQSNESKYYLFISNNVNGGLLTFDSNKDNIDDITLEISGNNTSKKYSYEDGKFKFLITTNTVVHLSEADEYHANISVKKIKELEKQAEQLIEKNIQKIIKKAKSEYKVDVFSLGSVVYKNNPKLWKKVKNDWEKKFLETEIEVKSDVDIINTGFFK
ncbi:MAG: Ger(x)C family spore germination protein [Bacilli bacterium]|nr:Ger(x)C family spore germination protein [Bacilli bacterium]MDD4411541.1 Ger(x)C family spore germination protein [Bacilli bacterium]